MTESTPAPASQTLSRGIRLLELLADARQHLSIDELAARAELHRSVTYRLLRTLEEHGLVARDDAGRVRLGARLAALAAGVSHDLQAEALPELTAAANELGMTCLVAVLDRDEAVTLVSIEPRHADGSVAQRPGTRHPITRGAPGKAILSLVAPADRSGATAEVRADLARVATDGYAVSADEVIPSLRSVAVPLGLRGRQPAAVAVVYVATAHSVQRIAARLQRAAEAIRSSLDG